MSETKSKVPDADKFAARLQMHARKGQYKQGSDLAKKILKAHPGDFYFTYQYAKLLGDWADDLPASRRKKLKSEAAGILKPLTRQLAGQSLGVRFGLCLNYYYQTYAFQSMYNFGKRFAAADPKQGLYAQALGAGLLAEERYRANALPSAKSWAEKSVRLWGRYGLKGEKYYFPFYCLAMSYLVLGDAAEASAQLQTAAKLSQRNVQCAEFKDLHKDIQRALKDQKNGK